jgi:hypothetical protein
MKTRDVVKLGTAVLAVLALGIFVQPASATVVGHIDFANCGSGGVAVAGGTIDFFLPLAVGLAGNNGCILAGGGSTVTFAGGSIAPGATGTVNDLGFAPPGSGNAGFITFTGIAFDLLSIGPGPTNLTCATTNDTNAASCAVAAGSPFKLSPTSTGTDISLSVRGLVTDSSGTFNWQGAFTTQITSILLASGGTEPGTAANIQSFVNGGGRISSTFSFAGDVGGAVPEPVSMALIGGGLIAFAFLKRRKARA